MFQTEESALQYLRQCDLIIIPSLYTYWCHCSLYSPSGQNVGKLWNSLPIDVVEVRHEMSFKTREQRFEQTIIHQDLKCAPTDYAIDTTQTLKNFQLKVVIPKPMLTENEKRLLDKDEQYFSDYNYAYRGLGDGRHPKLPNKTKIYIFGYTQNDEMSGKPIDTVWGVREKDLLNYANSVRRELYYTQQKFGSVPISKTPLFTNMSELQKFEKQRQMLNYGANLKIDKVRTNNLNMCREL